MSNYTINQRNPDLEMFQLENRILYIITSKIIVDWLWDIGYTIRKDSQPKLVSRQKYFLIVCQGREKQFGMY